MVTHYYVHNNRDTLNKVYNVNANPVHIHIPRTINNMFYFPSIQVNRQKVDEMIAILIQIH